LIKVLLYPGYLSEQDVSKHGIFFRKEIKNRIFFLKIANFFGKTKGANMTEYLCFLKKLATKKNQIKKRKRKNAGAECGNPPRM